MSNKIQHLKELALFAKNWTPEALEQFAIETVSLLEIFDKEIDQIKEKLNGKLLGKS